MAAKDLDASLASYGVETMTSHEGLCQAVANLCGGEGCKPSSQCASALKREELRNLVYRRYASQLYSTAEVISKALDGRPSKPAKKGATLSAVQSRLLHLFRTLALDDVSAFFGIPSAEMAKCPYGETRMIAIVGFVFCLLLICHLSLSLSVMWCSPFARLYRLKFG